MLISEIFLSIQGEGIFTGYPAVFLRFFGCNLNCLWCDSKFALKKSKNLSTEEVLKHIKKYKTNHLVITGGEPLLQQDEIKNLIKNLKNFFIEIETNGTITPLLDEFKGQFNVSPKLSNSKNKKYELQKFPQNKTYYKFIIDKKSDIEEIKLFIKNHNLDKKRVILMPQGTSKKELDKKAKWTIEICKKENFIFSTRLHIYIYGNKRKK